ncbi:hypothetical protein [Spirosoma sp. KNUC1025]|uniref:hypothetical protein n=1 Tax=Spirosoma sp. KNUC1025 TaxID=2894082 RepID=UPI003867D66A|nr:hypothetical protein LN737_09245 [Spirosoma sp. KNUC1025]
MKKALGLSKTSWMLIGGLSILQGCLGLLDPNDHNRGLIVSDYPTTAQADKWSCYVPDTFDGRQQVAKNNVVIDSDSALYAYFSYDTTQHSLNSPCRNYKPEPIDFSRYTLLGNYASGGCNVAFTRTVERDEHARQYVYTVKVREAGFCKKLEYSMNWVLVPKLQPGYRVAFLIQ